MASPEQFRKNIRRAARQVQTNSSRATRRTALAILQQLLTSTPVDTGRARANWNVGVETPDRTVRDADSPGTAGSTANANAQAALQRGQSRLAQVREGDATVYISNNLPYVDRLNQGSSAQAPAGFVEQAVLAGRVAARRTRLLRR